jgi:hypothetical protein
MKEFKKGILRFVAIIVVYPLLIILSPVDLLRILGGAEDVYISKIIDWVSKI